MKVITSSEEILTTTWSRHPSSQSYWVKRLKAIWDEWMPDRLIFDGDGRKVGPRDIVYRPATAGRWGRSSAVYVGRALKRERAAREAAQQEKREAEALAPYEDVLHEVLSACGAEGCFAVSLPPAWMRVGGGIMVHERLHDAGGSLGYRVESPAALREHLLRAIPGHRQIYHQ
jgi:hypothetical protein